jgi:hypothetical protein
MRIQKNISTTEKKKVISEKYSFAACAKSHFSGINKEVLRRGIQVSEWGE